jgi:hypothetical protein
MCVHFARAATGFILANVSFCRACRARFLIVGELLARCRPTLRLALWMGLSIQSWAVRTVGPRWVVCGGSGFCKPFRAASLRGGVACPSPRRGEQNSQSDTGFPARFTGGGGGACAPTPSRAVGRAASRSFA